MAYQKQNFQDGKVLSAEQLNRMDAALAAAPQSVNTAVGLKGYYWINLDSTNNSFELSTQQGECVAPAVVPYAVGDIVSLSSGQGFYPNCSTIVSIEGNVVTLDSLPESVANSVRSLDAQDIYACHYAVWVLEKPNAGDVDLGVGSFALGCNNIARGFGAGASGYLTKALGHFSYSEGLRTTALGARSHAEGSDTEALNECDHAEGYNTKAMGGTSHAEGNGTQASGGGSHAEGGNTKATGAKSHAEGINTIAEGDSSHAEGISTMATGICSHAEGAATVASGTDSHAEGATTVASGFASHAEGEGTLASSARAHAEGRQTKAIGTNTHAEGLSTIASGVNQHVQGKFNLEDAEGEYAHILGNGTSENTRSNAHTIDWDGNAFYAGEVETGAVILRSSTPGSSKKFRLTVDDSGTLAVTEV